MRSSRWHLQYLNCPYLIGGHSHHRETHSKPWCPCHFYSQTFETFQICFFLTIYLKFFWSHLLSFAYHLLTLKDFVWRIYHLKIAEKFTLFVSEVLQQEFLFLLGLLSVSKFLENLLGQVVFEIWFEFLVSEIWFKFLVLEIWLWLLLEIYLKLL